MRLLLLKPARINHDAGDIVEVSPAQASFLIGVGSAKPVEVFKETVTAETPEAKKAPRKTAKK